MINHPHRSKRTISTGPAAKPAPRARAHVDHGYDELLAGVQRTFGTAVSFSMPIFKTDADDLYEIYLHNLPSQRRHHTCSACKRFIQAYGHLAIIEDDGNLVSAMWDWAPEFYRPAVQAMAQRVSRANVTSVFLSRLPVWGLPVTGDWKHFAVTPPHSLVYREGALTAGQRMAAVRENKSTVFNAMVEFPPKVLDEAVRVLESGHLDRAEKFLGPVRWLRALHDWPKGSRNQRVRENLLWRAVASAPEGYCHIKSSVVAPLLADIVAGVPFETLQRRHAAKVDTTIYQRPQAAPAAGNIEAAEKLVEKLGLAPSLERRFARLQDVINNAVWVLGYESDHARAAAGGVFGHLEPKGATAAVPPVALPSTTVTWEKFARTVLPSVQRLQLMVPAHGRFIALTAPVHADAPLIFKWPNAIAWYVYPTGSPAHQWGLVGNMWREVTAVVPLPTMWAEPRMPHLSEGMVLVLDGALDQSRGHGNALFPECLRGDLHGIRSTVEAYSKRAEMAGRDDGSACGYDIRHGGAGRDADATLRVFAGGAWSAYRIDRWD